MPPRTRSRRGRKPRRWRASPTSTASNDSCKEAREAVAQAERILVALPDTMPIKAPLLSNCARAWGELGKKDRARELLSRVEALAPTVQPIERPAVYANAASSFALA